MGINGQDKIRSKKPRNVPVVERAHALAAAVPALLPLNVLRLVFIDDGLSGVKVRLMGLYTAALGPSHVPKEEDQVDGDAEIPRDNVLVVEV